MLDAAISGTQPEPVSAANAELFDRERELCEMPLEAAFDRLAVDVPALADVKGPAAEMSPKDPPPAGGGRFHGYFFAEFAQEAETLVGPTSEQADPLLRSSAALWVTLNYLDNLAGVTAAPDPRLPLALPVRPVHARSPRHWMQQRPWGLHY